MRQTWYGCKKSQWISERTLYRKIKQFYTEFFKNEEFVNFFSNGIPSLKSVNGTNNLNFSIHQDYDKKKIIMVSCIDNLIKGAAGQALQNMNLMFNFNELFLNVIFNLIKIWFLFLIFNMIFK